MDFQLNSFVIETAILLGAAYFLGFFIGMPARRILHRSFVSGEKAASGGSGAEATGAEVSDDGVVYPEAAAAGAGLAAAAAGALAQKAATEDEPEKGADEIGDLDDILKDEIPGEDEAGGETDAVAEADDLTGEAVGDGGVVEVKPDQAAEQAEADVDETEAETETETAEFETTDEEAASDSVDEANAGETSEDVTEDGGNTETSAASVADETGLDGDGDDTDDDDNDDGDGDGDGDDTEEKTVAASVEPAEDVVRSEPGDIPPKKPKRRFLGWLLN